MNLYGNSSDSLSSHRNRAERRHSPGLAAFHWKGYSAQQNAVKDISSTGAFLFTDERWAPDELISLTLQRIGPIEKTPENCFAVQAKVVRWNDHGVAVTFVLPPGADLRLWQSPLKSAADQTAPEDILREFRVARAIAFLSSISPGAANRIKKLLHEELSNYRLEKTIDIALKAEKMLGHAVETDKLRSKPEVALRIIESGSWSDDAWMLQFWAGLLASSCTPNGEDESSLAFVDLMFQVNSLHLRILTAASAKTARLVSGLGRISSRPVNWTSAELMNITGSRDLIKIDRELEHMSDMGLIAERVKSTFFTTITETRIEPTSLGLELYARCNGSRGTAQGFYGLPQADPRSSANDPNGASAKSNDSLQAPTTSSNSNSAPRPETGSPRIR